MAGYFGRELTTDDLMRRVGSMEQFAYARPFTYTQGKAAGVKAFEVSNGTGLDFTVLESKCMDIVSLKYKGVNLNYRPKSGLVSPALADMCGTEFMKSISGGMLYTCGLLNVGAACVCDGIDQLFHGRMKNTPADGARSETGFEDGDYTVRLRGEMREASIFGENLVMKRSITVKTGGRSIKICDTVVNDGFEDQELMLLYHINAGYPLLDEGARVLIPSIGLTPKDESSKANAGDYARVTAPQDGFTENVFLHRLAADEDGHTGAAVINDALGLGLYVRFSRDELQNLVQWRSLRSGDYAVGIMPSTCFVNGRRWEKENARLKRVAARSSLRFELELGVLDGAGDIRAFEEYVGRLSRG